MDADVSAAIRENARQINELKELIRQIARQSGASGQSINVDKVNRVFDGFSDSVESAAGSLEDLDNVLRKASKQDLYNKEKQQLEDRLSNESSFFSKKKKLEEETLRHQVEEIGRSVLAHKQRLRDLQEEKQTASKKIKDARQYIKDNRSAHRDAIASLEVLQKELEEQERAKGSIAAQIRVKHIQEEITKHQKVVDAYNEHRNEIRKVIESQKRNNTEVQTLTTQLQEFNDAFDERITEFKGISAKNWFKDAIQNVSGASKAAFLVGVNQYWDSVRSQIDRQVDLAGIGSTQTASLGMTPAEFAEATGEFRRAMLAAGGLGASTEHLSKAQDELMTVISDPKKRTEFALQQMEMLSRAGITGVKTYEAALQRSAKRFSEVQKITGMTGEQYMTTMRDMMEDESTIMLMRQTATQEERDIILDGIEARYKEYRAMGMMDEQARAVTKSLNKMLGAGPMERFKKSVQAQLMMGALGVSGGQEYAAALRKGRFASESEKRMMVQKNTEISNKITQAYAGSEGQGFVFEQLAEKTGFTPEAMAEYNTQMLTPIKDAVDKNSETFQKVGELWTEGANIISNAISQFNNNPIWKMIVGALGGGVWLVTMGLQIKALWDNTKALIANTLSKGGGITDLLTGKGGKGKIGAVKNAVVAASGLEGAMAAGEIAKGKALATGATVNTAKIAGGVGAGKEAFKAAGAAKGVWAISALMGAYEGITTYDEKKQNLGESVGKGVGIAGGGVGGAAIGTAVGAAIGSVIAPGIGTAIGGWLGGAAGGWLGTEIGDNVGTAVGKSMDENARQRGAAEVKTPNPEAIIKPEPARETKLIEETVAKTAARLKDAEKSTDIMESSIASTISEQTATQASDKVEQRAERQTAIQQQLAKMTESNDYLKVVADNVPTLVDIANKQLLAMTLTEKEKEDSSRINKMRTDSGYGATYNFIS